MTFPEARGRQIVVQRSHERCEGCRCHRGMSFQHRVKRGQGGLWAPSNGVRLCGSGTTLCHGDIEAMPELGRILGLGLLSGDDPLTQPAYLHTVNGTGWWLLDDDGCYSPFHDVTDEQREAAQAWDSRSSHRPSPSTSTFLSNPYRKGR